MAFHAGKDVVCALFCRVTHDAQIFHYSTVIMSIACINFFIV